MKKTLSGFTIVELLIVIVVIGILAAITLVAYNGVQVRARDAVRLSDISAMKKALEMYAVDNGSYPNSSQMATASFWQNTLNLKNSNVMPPNSALGPAYCWPGTVGRYCYVGSGRSDGQAGDCTGYSPQSPSITCSGFIINYVLEKDPSTEILLKNG